ncbi:MAG: 3-isopropylmalate dehydratase small subunit [Candidatus Thiodiazotropha sp. (ex Cardiolucina cf. quadrata)]|nr:3-isopropylmalate dehydratase small subunit [Candidatus Thiodiazotropha sp. (ex Cardiolucina cf. quadrata)]
MTDSSCINGIAAPLNIDNLDTDQIMPKQFLRGIDKKGLDQGLLWDLRFNGEGEIRPEFILNRPEYRNTRILVTGPNFGCGSSREHAVWGLQQYGIQAVIASSFGEIFYSNAMNNGLLAVMLPQDEVAEILEKLSRKQEPQQLEIDLATMQVRAFSNVIPFILSDRHRNMFLEGVDMVGASLGYKEKILEFANAHWTRQPWVRNIAIRTMQRL